MSILKRRSQVFLPPGILSQLFWKTPLFLLEMESMTLWYLFIGSVTIFHVLVTSQVKVWSEVRREGEGKEKEKHYVLGLRIDELGWSFIWSMLLHSHLIWCYLRQPRLIIYWHLFFHINFLLLLKASSAPVRHGYLFFPTIPLSGNTVLLSHIPFPQDFKKCCPSFEVLSGLHHPLLLIMSHINSFEM